MYDGRRASSSPVDPIHLPLERDTPVFHGVAPDINHAEPRILWFGRSIREVDEADPIVTK